MSNILNGITEVKRSPETDFNRPSWDNMVSNVGQKAKEGPRKTVWVPDQYGKGGRYTTVPVNAPKKDEPTKESVGLPYPSTYEETNDMFKSSGQRRIGTLTTENDDPFRGTGGAFNRGDDERHDLDPSDWYKKIGTKMHTASIYPRQVAQAQKEGWHRTKEEARANAISEGVAEGSLNEFAPDGFNGGDDSNDLQLYLNVAKKLNMKKYKPSTAHNLIAKKMAELVDVVDDAKVDWARHMARKEQGLPNMLEQGVAEAAPVNTTPEFTRYVYSKLRKNFSDLAQVEDLFDYAYLSDVTLGAISDAMEENGTSAQQELKERLTWLLKNMNDRKYLSVIKPIAVEWMKLVAPTLGRQGVDEEKQRLDPKCWTGKHKEGTKMKGGVRVNNCVPNESAIMKGIKV